MSPPTPPPTHGADDSAANAHGDRPSILVVYSPTNTAKIARHVGPLAEVADVTMVCITPDESIEAIDYRTVPTFGRRSIGLLLTFVVALAEAVRGDYDGIGSFSLFPNGCFALVAGAVAGVPAHLGILGIDADVHAEAWYGPLVAWLFRRFDAVSVPGTAHRSQLIERGVSPARVTVLANAIDADVYRPPDDDPEPDYDVVWVGRFKEVNDPLLFVRALVRLRERGTEVGAIMVGDGPLRTAVEDELRAHDLFDAVELAGWVDEPADYYRRGRVFALTSERDALPLTLIEAMATGTPAVVPRVGNVPDVAVDGETALVVEELTSETLADALDRLLDDAELRAELATNATRVRDRYSYAAATDDWVRILGRMGVGIVTEARTGESDGLEP